MFSLALFDSTPVNLSELTERWGIGILIFLCTTVASYVMGRLAGYYKARAQWLQKDFSGRILVSVNSIVGGTLKIRTLLERSLEEIFLNPLAVAKVQEAARR